MAKILHSAEENHLKITGWPVFYINVSDSTWENVITVLDSMEVPLDESDLGKQLNSLDRVYDDIDDIRLAMNEHLAANEAFTASMKNLKAQRDALNTKQCIPFDADSRQPDLDKNYVSTFKKCLFYYESVQREINDKFANLIKLTEEFKIHKEKLLNKAITITQVKEKKSILDMLRSLTSENELIKSDVPIVVGDLNKFLINRQKIVFSLYKGVEQGHDKEKKGFLGRKKIVHCLNLG